MDGAVFSGCPDFSNGELLSIGFVDFVCKFKVRQGRNSVVVAEVDDGELSGVRLGESKVRVNGAQIGDPEPFDALVLELVVSAEQLVAAADGKQGRVVVEGRLDRVALGRQQVDGDRALVANATAEDRVQAIAALRKLAPTGPEIAELLEMATSTVSAVLGRIGLGKLSRLEPKEPPRRYEKHRHEDRMRRPRQHAQRRRPLQLEILCMCGCAVCKTRDCHSPFGCFWGLLVGAVNLQFTWKD